MFGNLTTLPVNVTTFLDGQDLAKKQHAAMMLLTVTEDFWPHSAMISVGEVVALDERHLRFAMWPNTTTTNNMERTGQATLILIHDGKAYYIRVRLSVLPENPNARHPRKRFSATVEGVREDVAKYADITSGIQIKLKDPGKVISRWRDTVEDLLVD